MKWYERPWGVLLLLFVVLGPLGLPFLWRSSGFSRAAKVILTAAVILYPGWLLSLVGRMSQLSLEQVERLATMPS